MLRLRMQVQRARDETLSSWLVVWSLSVCFMQVRQQQKTEARGRAACHGKRLASEATVHDACIGKYTGRNSECFRILMKLLPPARVLMLVVVVVVVVVV